MIQTAWLTALACAALAFGQQKKHVPAPAPAQPQTVFPLETLKVAGNARISVERIIAASGLKIGAPVAKDDFDKARARLLATGAFESVGYEFKPSPSNTGYAGLIEVVEVEQIFPYRLEDLPVPENVLRAELRKQELVLGDEIPGTAEVIGRYVREIQAMVGDKVKVTGKVSNDIPGKLTILFRPDTPRPQVAEVHFTGNKVLPSSELMRSINDVAIGTAYSETTMRILLDASVRPLYDARGRIRVAFPRIATASANEIDGVVVTVTVEEGESYSLGAVKFANSTARESDELQRMANIRSQDIANFDDVKAGLDRIYAKFRDKGYLKVTGHVDRQIDDQAHRVDLLITIDSGPRYTMGKLEIEGLDLVSEPVIRKMWGLKQGDAFQPGYPDSFLNDIREQGIFDNLGKTAATTDIDEKTHTVDVKLNFAGGGKDQQQKKRKKAGEGGWPFPYLRALELF